MSSTGIDEEARQYIHERKQNGNEYVQSTNLSNTLGFSGHRAGKVLKRLKERGELELWTKGSDRYIYRIGEVDVESLNDTTGTDRVESRDGCDWVLGNPHQTIDEVFTRYSLCERGLGEVLDEIERAEHCLGLNQRLGMGRISTCKEMVGDLGLTKESGELLDEPERSERIEAMREEYL